MAIGYGNTFMYALYTLYLGGQRGARGEAANERFKRASCMAAAAREGENDKTCVDVGAYPALNPYHATKRTLSVRASIGATR
jgi:hypothetical protein